VPRSTDTLRLADARRIALAAQGFGAKRGTANTRPTSIATIVRKLGLLQIDSVNVLVRSHYLPVFSRLGPYDRALLDRLAYRRPRALFEYWGHEASLVPVQTYPLLRWRMKRARRHVGMWSSMSLVAREQPALIARLRATIAERGPMSSSEFEGSRGTGSWWGWSEIKRGLEYLFYAGIVSTATRRGSFERLYDLTERVLPPDVLETPEMSEADAQRDLVRIAARALGIATESDLRDYFRLDLADARARVEELVEANELIPVDVESWKQRAFVVADRVVPRRIAASALLSPFDSLIWHRPRALRLFDLDYRLEIYTPSHKRVHGYYVLPYLLDERFVARVDLKADRVARELRAIAIHFEAGISPAEVLPHLELELGAMAAWLGLERYTLPSATRHDDPPKKPRRVID
jgi:uncharacterized protein YcaQ